MDSSAAACVVVKESSNVLDDKPVSCSIVGRRFANNLEDHAVVVSPMTWDAAAGKLSLLQPEPHPPCTQSLDRLSAPKHAPQRHFTWKPLKAAQGPNQGESFDEALASTSTAVQKASWRTPGIYRPATAYAGSSMNAGEAGAEVDSEAGVGSPAAAALALTGRPHTAAAVTSSYVSPAGWSKGGSRSSTGQSRYRGLHDQQAGPGGGASGLVNSRRNLLAAMRASYGVLFNPPGIQDDDSETEGDKMLEKASAKASQTNQNTSSTCSSSPGSKDDTTTSSTSQTAGFKGNREKRRWARRLAAEQQLSGKWGEKDFTWGGALLKKNTHLAGMAAAGTNSIKRTQHSNSAPHQQQESDEEQAPPPQFVDPLQTGPWGGEKWHSNRASTAGAARGSVAGGPRSSAAGAARSSVAGGVRSSVAGDADTGPAAGYHSSARSSVNGGGRGGATAVTTTSNTKSDSSGLPSALLHASGMIGAAADGYSSSKLLRAATAYLASHSSSDGTTRSTRSRASAAADAVKESEWKQELPFTAALLSGRALKQHDVPHVAARPATAGEPRLLGPLGSTLRLKSDQQQQTRWWGQDQEECDADAPITSGSTQMLRLRWSAVR